MIRRNYTAKGREEEQHDRNRSRWEILICGKKKMHWWRAYDVREMRRNERMVKKPKEKRKEEIQKCWRRGWTQIPHTNSSENLCLICSGLFAGVRLGLYLRQEGGPWMWRTSTGSLWKYGGKIVLLGEGMCVWWVSGLRGVLAVPKRIDKLL